MKHIFNPEIRYTHEGYKLRQGQKVWTRKLVNPTLISGETVKAKYGVYKGLEMRADGPYRLRHLRNKEMVKCRLCGKPIYKGELCAANKYCMNCVLPFEPEREFIPEER